MNHCLLTLTSLNESLLINLDYIQSVFFHAYTNLSVSNLVGLASNVTSEPGVKVTKFFTVSISLAIVVGLARLGVPKISTMYNLI